MEKIYLYISFFIFIFISNEIILYGLIFGHFNFLDDQIELLVFDIFGCSEQHYLAVLIIMFVVQLLLYYSLQEHYFHHELLPSYLKLILHFVTIHPHESFVIMWSRIGFFHYIISQAEYYDFSPSFYSHFDWLQGFEQFDSTRRTSIVVHQLCFWTVSRHSLSTTCHPGSAQLLLMFANFIFSSVAASAEFLFSGLRLGMLILCNSCSDCVSC